MRAILAALILLAGTAGTADAATRYVTPTGSGTACTVLAPCGSFQAAYNSAASGDAVQVAGGTYGGQDIDGGNKAITFTGAPGVELQRDLGIGASNVTLDGINIDAHRFKGVALYVNAANITFRNAYVRNVVDNQMVLVTQYAPGTVFDKVRFTDATRTSTAVHMECIYSMGANIAIRNSYFENCAVMDVFFTLQVPPAYGGWELTGNTFKYPRNVNGTGQAFYSVMWAWQNSYDRATVRGNTYEAGVTAQTPQGNAASFTNSVESCNTPAFNLPGMVKQVCGTPSPTPTPTANPSPTATPTPEPTPTPTASPTETPTPEPTATPSPEPYEPECAPTCDQQITDLAGQLKDLKTRIDQALLALEGTS